MADEWITAGENEAKPVATDLRIPADDSIEVPNPETNKRYTAVTSELRKAHAELLAMEKDGRLSIGTDNPALIGDYLAKLRLNCNLLFRFMNEYIDIMNDLQREAAVKRQTLFEEALANKKTPNAAENLSREMTRIDENNAKQVENRISQIKNEYERFNGICIFLHSRLREFNTERIMG